MRELEGGRELEGREGEEEGGREGGEEGSRDIQSLTCYVQVLSVV